MIEDPTLKKTILTSNIAPTPAATPGPLTTMSESSENIEVLKDTPTPQANGIPSNQENKEPESALVKDQTSVSVESGRRGSGLPRPQLQAVTNVLKSMRAHVDADPFKMPVNPAVDGVPDYLNIVKEPMDLFTIGKKLEESQYETVDEVIADVRLIVSNCVLFNGPDSWVTQKAKSLESYFDQKLLSKLVNVKPSPSYNVVPSLKPLPEPSKPAKSSKMVVSDLEFSRKVVKDFATNKRRVAYAFPFLEPVDPVKLNIPQYFDIIKQPMDLSTVEKKFESGVYTTAEEVDADVRLMLQNCFTFNAPEHLIHKTGKVFEREYNKEWAKRPSVKEALAAQKQAANSRAAAQTKPLPSAPVLRKRTVSEVKRMAESPAVHSRRNSIDWDATPIVTDSDSDDDEIEQQLRLLQQNLNMINGQLQLLLNKRFKKKKIKRSKSTGSRHKFVDVVVDGSRKPHSSKTKKSGGASSPASRNVHKKGSSAGAAAKAKQSNQPVEVAPTSAVPLAEPDLPDLTYEQKAELSEGISILEGQPLLDVLSIIQQSLPNLGGPGSEEIELDVEALDKKTLWRLHNLVIGSRQPRANGAPKPSESDSSDTESEH